MERQEQYMIFFSEPEQLCAHEWSGSEIERSAHFVEHESLTCVIVDVKEWQFEFQHWSDQLYGLSVLHGEGRAQRLVPPDDLIEAPSQGVNAQRSLHVHGSRNVVERVIRVESIKKPETLLGRRERQRAVTQYGDAWRHRWRLA